MSGSCVSNSEPLNSDNNYIVVEVKRLKRKCRRTTKDTGLRSGLRPTTYPSGCLGATRTAAGPLATSSSASAAMTPCRAALWDQQEQQAATPASYRASGSASYRASGSTPCRAALWDQQEQQVAAPASYRASGSTPCRAALWDQQEQQVGAPASCRASGSTPCRAALWDQQQHLATPASYRASGSGRKGCAPAEPWQGMFIHSRLLPCHVRRPTMQQRLRCHRVHPCHLRGTASEQ
ncbi:uncharacterized protein LOC142567995 [Dermacentor variabilis]|uniref:uncharacterized protein LOC142567995 n=1 Tax=Dermacentor variabilis TaxID=34621 RepID=UPI003F5BB3CF